MIAKVTVHGPTRGAALRQLERVLRHTDVGGTVTNVSFLAALAAQADFAAGDVDTGLIDREIAALTPAPVACSKARSIAALAALGLDQGAGDLGGFSLWDPLGWEVKLTHHDEEIAARVLAHGPDSFDVSVGDVHHRVERRGGLWWVDATRVQARVARKGHDVTVFWGNGYRFRIVDPLDRDSDAAGDGNLIEAPMPGLVKAVYAEPGQAVRTGDRLAVLEAMKMEHSLLAARDGIVAEVLVAAGTQVEAGEALVRLEAEES